MSRQVNRFVLDVVGPLSGAGWIISTPAPPHLLKVPGLDDGRRIIVVVDSSRNRTRREMRKVLSTTSDTETERHRQHRPYQYAHPGHASLAEPSLSKRAWSKARSRASRCSRALLI